MSIVQSLWLGSRLSALQVLSLRSFLAHGHEVHLYALEPIENVPPGIHLLDASAVLPRERVFTYQRGFGRGSPSAFSNLFRYKLLLERGGWWVDTDVVCLRPFDLDADLVFASERAVDGRITAASCVIKSPAGADWLEYCLDIAERRDPSSLEWGEIGPKLMQDAQERFALQGYLVPPQVFNPIDYFAYGELQEPAFDHARLRDSLAVHLWNQKWVSHCVDPDFDGAPDSLYAALRARYLHPSDRAYPAGEEWLRHAQFQRARIEELVLNRDDAHWAAEASAREVAGLREALRMSHAEIERRQATEHLLEEMTVRLHEMTVRLRETESVLHETETRQRETAERLGTTERARQDATEQVDRLREEVNRLYNSLSWRMTRPFRAILDAIRNR